MNTEGMDKRASEGAVSENQASIPSEVREAADIEDGDRIRWHWGDEQLRVEVIRERHDVLSEDFDGFEPEETQDAHHDEAGLEPSGDWDHGDG